MHQGMHRLLVHTRWANKMSRTTEHKEGRATVEIYYKTGKTLADGSHPFQIRVTKDRKQIYRSTGLSLLPEYWNAKKKHIRKSYPEPDREELITQLASWVKKYSDAAKVQAAADEPHDAADVLLAVAATRAATRRYKLLAYFDHIVQALRDAGRLSNANVYRDTRNPLAKFIAAEYGGATDIGFERVTVKFCDEWEAKLRTTGVAETTLSVRFRTLQALMSKAMAEGLVRAEQYPFARAVAEKDKFHVGKFNTSTRKRALPREAVRRLEGLQPTTDRLRLAKDVFVFSFYAGGISFVDLAQLCWRDLNDEDPETGYPERILYTREKTKRKKNSRELSIKLLPPAAAIVYAYRPFTYAGPDSYVFPILNSTRHVTPVQLDNRLHKVQGQVNQDLKTLGEMAGISTPLTSYVARHSFATTLKMSGASTAIISQAMGQKSEKVTEIYLDSFASELVDSAFDGLL